MAQLSPPSLTSPVYTAAQLAAIVGGEIVGSAEAIVTHPVPLHVADPAGFAFVRDASRLNDANAQAKGLLIVPKGTGPLGIPTLEVDHPELRFFQILQRLVRPLPLSEGIDLRAAVADGAVVHDEASVGPFAVIAEGARVEKRARIHPFAYVGPGCHVGEGCEVMPHAVLVQDVTLHPNTKIWPGAVLGSDGFGYVPMGGRQVKRPHVGRVEVGPDAEIGANSTIDRASVGVTRVGEDVKLDNLVQIGHNVEVGDHSVLAAQVGIGGSSIVGKWSVFGGQVGVADHVKIPPQTHLGGQVGVIRNSIPESGAYFGTPPMPYRSALRAYAALRELPALLKRVKELEEAQKEQKSS